MKIDKIVKLNSLLWRQDKLFLFWMLLFTIFISMMETIGISAIMPFISVASNPELIEQKYYLLIYRLFEFSDKNSFIVAFGTLLICFYFFRAFINMFYAHLLNIFSYGIYHRFASRLFQAYIFMPYKVFVSRNSATLTKTIMTDSNHLSSIIQNLLIILSELFTIIFLYVMLLIVNIKMTIALTLILTLKIIFIVKKISKVIHRQGAVRFSLQDRFFRIINESFGNFKIIKLVGEKNKVLNIFDSASKAHADSNIVSSTLMQAPRNIMETIGFSMLIASVLYIVVKYNDAAMVIPIISMYALALYRMLPALNKIMTSYNVILSYSKSLDVIYDDLHFEIENEGYSDIYFHSSIEIKNLNFNYSDKVTVFEGLNLTIKKGEKVAFVGPSGGGKSTLVDLIVGIYRPTSGSITVDGIALDNNNMGSWRKKVGYIPQSIYLFDGTVAQNVSFGYEYNEEKVVDVLKKANIFSFLLTKEGIHTAVGDGGIQLSGGQKQRIGIARALYSEPEILVLDEATSALDSETEAKIMDEIYSVSEGKTLLVIAHRLSTVERCDRVIKIENGRIV